MITDYANRVPPFLCRLFARKRNGRVPSTCRDLAALSGLSKSWVSEISAMTSWDLVSIADADAFARACGVDFDNPHLVADHFRRSKRVFLFTSHPNQRALFMRLMRLGSKLSSAPHHD